jgi:hypothetical protein
MYSFSYLAGLQHKIKKLFEEGLSFTCDDKQRLFVEKPAIGRQELDYSSYSNWKEVIARSDLLERVNCSNELIGLPILKNFDEALGLLVLEEELGNRITAVIDHYRLQYSLNISGGETVIVPLSKVPDYDTLVAAHCVRRGYIISEVAGRHFLLQSPTGLKHVTTAFACTCSDFATKKDCEHVRLVKIIMFNHHKFYRRGIVNLISQ